MSIEPSLATSWERLPDEDGWRFFLREGVTFHDGADFDARRRPVFLRSAAYPSQSDVKSWFAPVTEVRVVDDYTVDFITAAPNPLFPEKHRQLADHGSRLGRGE